MSYYGERGALGAQYREASVAPAVAPAVPRPSQSRVISLHQNIVALLKRLISL